MHSKWVLPALPLCLSVAFAWSQPACHADWRDSLLRAMAPRLVDRTFDYLMRERPRRADTAPEQAAPRWAGATGTARPAPKTSAPKKSTAGAGSASTATTQRSASVPPPPNTLVPPPPPGVPTGAILGLYPQQLNADPESLTASLKPARRGDPPPPRIVLDKTPTDVEAEPVMPKPAPDFRSRQRH